MRHDRRIDIVARERTGPAGQSQRGILFHRPQFKHRIAGRVIQTGKEDDFQIRRPAADGKTGQG